MTAAPAGAPPQTAEAERVVLDVVYLGHTDNALHLCAIDGPGVGWVPRSMLLLPGGHRFGGADLAELQAMRRQWGRAVQKLSVPRWKLAELGWFGAGEGQGSLFG
jgi:hypothetical protein